MLTALGRAMRFRDRRTHEHSERVRDYAMALARAADVTDAETLDAIDAASELHDIGKLCVPDQILLKPGPLTRDEYIVVKEHAGIGADMLSAFPSALAEIVRHHHENWDGTGYPDGLAGEAIPVGARVLAIADCYDALTSERPYRRALSHNSAASMVHERRGTMYDPRLVDVFMRIIWGMRPASTGRLCVYRPVARTSEPREAGVR